MSQAAMDYGKRMVAVEVIGDYEVRVSFSDGVVADCDLRRRYVHPDGRLISNPSGFARVRLDADSDSLVWPDEFIHEHGESLYDTFVMRDASA